MTDIQTKSHISHTFTHYTGTDYDIIIIGGGPAGMSAAICASRAGLRTLILEKAILGGQVTLSYKINNVLGCPSNILGEQLANLMIDNLNAHKIDIQYENVEDILSPSSSHKLVKTDLGNTYQSKSVIIATGLEPQKLNTSFESMFYGRGISYYAKSDCDNYANEDVAVIGGGNCACYAADFLADVAQRVYLIHSSDTVKAVATLKTNIMNNPKITHMWNSKVSDAFGIDKLEKLKITNTLNDQHTWIDVKAAFIYVGRIPPRIPISLELKCDEERFIITDDTMRTNIPGVYAVGDIRSKQIRQISTAISDGMIAAINAERDQRK